MGHQTLIKKCKKCDEAIISTITFGKKIIHTKCKCDKELEIKDK